MQALVSRWGNSIGIRIPKEIATRVGLTNGSKVEIEVRDGQVIIGRRRPRYKLADLLVGVTPQQAREAASEVDWGADIGREIVD